MTQDESVPAYERAIYSSFGGNVQQLLTVCKSWEDYLWAYSKGNWTETIEMLIQGFLATLGLSFGNKLIAILGEPEHLKKKLSRWLTSLYVCTVSRILAII